MRRGNFRFSSGCRTIPLLSHHQQTALPPVPRGRADAVIVGSGASGGWAAKRLAEAGLQVVGARSGRTRTEDDNREHVPAFALKYRGHSKAPLARERPRQSASYACDEWNADWYVSDLAEPYTDDTPFPWVGRLRLVGGRTNVWGRQSYRFSDADFKAASHDGAGVDWPIGYADLAPYYDPRRALRRRLGQA